LITELVRQFNAMGIACRHPDHAGTYTTLGIGGRVGMSVLIHKPETMGLVIRTLNSGEHPHVILGGGSNTVFPENAPRLTLVLNRMRGITFQEPGRIVVRSGETNLDLMAWCARNGGAGLEFLAGIPGTIGGAAAVNAGAFGSCMAEVVESARILDPNGKETHVNTDFFQFSYRDSRFRRGKLPLIDITLRIRSDDPKKVRERIREHFRYRHAHHPHPTAQTAGCFFKNPRQDGSMSAGRLIDAAGLRGTRRNGLEVAPQHANFIVHHGGAGFGELREFVDWIRHSVEEKRGIRLEREVLFVSPDGQRF